MKITRSMAIGFAAVAMLAAATGNRKVTNNAQSPSADTSVKLKGREITIEYNAPSARGRKVEGGLIPYGQWYRMGADSATTLTTDADVTIGSLQVPKGVHTLYLLASENGDWKLIVNNQTGQWGTVYDESKDLGRTSMKVTKLSSPVDTFKITLASVEPDQATLSVEWGTTKASVPVKLR
jgi:hypothetical protein